MSGAIGYKNSSRVAKMCRVIGIVRNALFIWSAETIVPQTRCMTGAVPEIVRPCLGGDPLSDD